MSDRNQLKRYLLGQGSPEERQELENGYLSDPGTFEKLVEIENDLIDSYARGRLSPVDRDEFELRYLHSSKGRARLGFSRTLAEISHEQGPDKDAYQGDSLWTRLTTPFRQGHLSLPWALATSAILVLAIGLWRLTEDRSRVAVLPAKPSESIRPQPPSEQLASAPQPPSPGTEVAKAVMPALPVFTMNLSFGVARNAEATGKVYTIPPNTAWVRLLLSTDDEDHVAYTAEVETAEGQKIQSVGGLKRHVINGKQVVDLRLPAHLFLPGDYVIDLRSGQDSATFETVDSYSFRIARR